MKRIGLRRIGVVVLLVLAVAMTLALAVVGNTLMLRSAQLNVPPSVLAALDLTAAAERLAGGIRIATVSKDGAAADLQSLHWLHDYLEAQFPALHRTLTREVVGGGSLLYVWSGTDPAAKPVLLLAHQDVVPIAPGSEGDWLVDPFAGVVKDGYIWGRGAWDDKGSLFAILEAIELLVNEGFQPRQTVYLAFGHDEEVGGMQGAAALAALLQARGVRLDFVLDEGLIITEGVLKGLDRPLALIGIAEKGYADIRLSTRVEGGHASMPPPRSAIGSMSRALAALEQQPMPASLSGIARQMLSTIAPEMDLMHRVLLGNLWLFGPLVRDQLQRAASSNAMLRTTTALTVVHAGNKSNVLPSRAEAFINFRIVPGDSSDAVIRHVQATVNDPAIAVEKQTFFSEPSRVSRTDAVAYHLLTRTIREVFPEVVVAPGLVLAATDSRRFEAVADNIYRFVPVRARADDLARFHGSNERISLVNYAELIQFYRRLLLNVSGQPPMR